MSQSFLDVLQAVRVGVRVEWAFGVELDGSAIATERPDRGVLDADLGLSACEITACPASWIAIRLSFSLAAILVSALFRKSSTGLSSAISTLAARSKSRVAWKAAAEGFTSSSEAPSTRR